MNTSARARRPRDVTPPSKLTYFTTARGEALTRLRVILDSLGAVPAEPDELRPRASVEVAPLPVQLDLFGAK